jgi:hypothetical protein
MPLGWTLTGHLLAVGNHLSKISALSCFRLANSPFMDLVQKSGFDYDKKEVIATT